MHGPKLLLCAPKIKCPTDDPVKLKQCLQEVDDLLGDLLALQLFYYIYICGCWNPFNWDVCVFAQVPPIYITYQTYNLGFSPVVDGLIIPKSPDSLLV